MEYFEKIKNINNKLLFYFRYLLFKIIFNIYLKKANDENIIELTKTCIHELHKIISQNFAECCEGIDPWAGPSPICLVHKKLLQIFLNHKGFINYFITIHLKENIFKTLSTTINLKQTDICINAFQDRLRVIGDEAAINAYTTFANTLEKAIHGGITVKEPLFIPAKNNSDILFVIFAGMCCFPEFRSTISKMHKVDQLHVLDPYRSWYMQDPEGLWSGYEFYSSILLKQINKIKENNNYKQIIFLGNSAGGSGAFLFSKFADTIISFCPQTQISAEHIPNEIHQKYEKLFLKNIKLAISEGKSVYVHRGMADIDVKQCNRLPNGVKLIIHRDCNVHNLPGYLKRKEVLINLFKDLL